MIYTKKVTFSLLTIAALGIAAAWEGFKIFRAERNSN